MPVNHDIVRPIVAVLIGLLVAYWAYQFVTDPQRAEQRAKEETVVLSARDILQSYIAPDMKIEIVDPLAPNSKVGKVYIFPTREGWEITGFYRRNTVDPWHPYLMVLHIDVSLKSLLVRDPEERLAALADEDPRFAIDAPEQ